MIAIALLCGALTLSYVFLTWNFGYWKKRGIKGPQPKLFVGSFPNIVSQKQNFAKDLQDVYNKYKDTETVVGAFILRSPTLVVVDVEQVNSVFVTAFANFHDNEFAKMVDPKKDILFTNNPFILNGEDWRQQRALVAPGLTQSRIKASYPEMVSVAKNLCNYIQEQSMEDKWINGRNLALLFTAENICQSVLGIKGESFTDKPIPISENVKKMFTENPIVFVYTFISGFIPSLSKIYRVKLSPKECEEFFFDLMLRTFTMRREQRIDRQDFIDYILSLTEKKSLNDKSLVSHAMTFLIDGLDTSATVIAHSLLLLGANPNKTIKLREEILQNLNKNGHLDFQTLHDMPYLDACVHEALRIYPPGLFINKSVTSDYAFTGKDGSQIKVYANENVIIPVYAIHHDETIYPKPHEFQPERFLPEQGGVKKYRDMGAFLGFGNGPRICLGMRFALTQTKLAVASIIKNFNVQIDPKTQINKLNPKSMLAEQDGGVWLKFEKVT